MDDERVSREGNERLRISGISIVSFSLGLLGIVECLFIFFIEATDGAGFSRYCYSHGIASDIFLIALMCFGVSGLILGLVAEYQISGNPTALRGRPLAQAGILMGLVLLVMSVLLPVFMLRGHASPKVNCLNNLKQIGTAINMYMSDWDDRYPLVSGPGREFERVFGYTYNYRTKSNGGERRWFQDLCAPYAKNKKIFMCPEAGKKGEWVTPRGTVSYASNRHGGYTDKDFQAQGVRGTEDARRWAIPKAPRGSSVRGLQPENDPPTSYWFNTVAVCGLENGGTKVISGQSEAICARTADAPIVWDTPCGFTVGRSKDAQLAHEDVINVCYADGHAKPWQIPNPREDEWTKDHFGNTHGYEGWFEEY